ncbi:protein kinase [Aspergillus pseudoustus]|uniref:non-specific serine/threonine protein kinase n=1 Tax=Aspergillus pseudoustus TaxID=1810923 RepID=A0ABR4K215_9EURO
MLRLARCPARSLFKRPATPARQFSKSSILLGSSKKLEEETLQWYSPERFYPVNIGDIFHSSYQVLGNLGYGGYSTVWLCRDLGKAIIQQAYVALRVYERDSAYGKRETEVYKHLNVGSDHTGFVLSTYQSPVHPSLAMSLFELRNRSANKYLPEKLLKPTLVHILLALDFLHTEAHIAHTDLQSKNSMLSVEDESIISGDQVIHRSRALSIPRIHRRPILADFGEPLNYRAPKVVLRTPWLHKIDDLFEPGPLFYAQDSDKKNSDSHHLAEMIALLGPPPTDIIQKSKHESNLFDHQENWISTTDITPTSLEKLEVNLQGKDRELFLRFKRKMLQWRPEDRASAKGVLSDP